ncbi:hypothetical protein KHA80_06100 [Anaerobacillus sp. HL2]|nr:hypothetical protein KHA80_06100 [Anaerobacillus sp. HL2]
MGTNVLISMDYQVLILEKWRWLVVLYHQQLLLIYGLFIVACFTNRSTNSDLFGLGFALFLLAMIVAIVNITEAQEKIYIIIYGQG